MRFVQKLGLCFDCSILPFLPLIFLINLTFAANKHSFSVRNFALDRLRIFLIFLDPCPTSRNAKVIHGRDRATGTIFCTDSLNICQPKRFAVSYRHKGLTDISRKPLKFIMTFIKQVKMNCLSLEISIFNSGHSL